MSTNAEAYLSQRLAELNVQPSNGNIRELSITNSETAPHPLPVLYDKQLLKLLKEGSREEVERGLHDDIPTANAQNRYGETLLHKACRFTFRSRARDLPERCRHVTHEEHMHNDWLVDTLLSHKVTHSMLKSFTPWLFIVAVTVQRLLLVVVALYARDCIRLLQKSHCCFVDRQADPMVMCDSSRNLLHDLFWTAKPPPLTVNRSLGCCIRSTCCEGHAQTERRRQAHTEQQRGQ